MQQDWRVFRPAIWLTILAIAVGLVLNLPVGVALLGGAIGTAARIETRRRRLRRGSAGTLRSRRR